MGIIDTIKDEFATKVEDNPQAPVTPEIPKESVQETPAVDRSAFNCPTCGGEGLVADAFEAGGFVRCPNCGGTGKV